MRPWPLLFLALSFFPATAQNNAAKPATGTVTGHVYCADTNAPARMASVQLAPHREPEKGSGTSHFSGVAHVGGVVQTGFDGSFTLSNVSPGWYDVIVSKSGYLAPRPSTDDSDAAEPAPSAGQPPIVIPSVDVQADQTASIDIRLERGAAISGTVRFDDGSPAAGVRVMVLHKSKEKWVPSIAAPIGITFMPITDDLGHYRVSGLRDREYLVELQLGRADWIAPSPHSGSLQSVTRTMIEIFSGDTAHIRDAIPFKLSPGEDRIGEDITIPLSKFHTVSGVVIAVSDGHPLNGAFLEIVESDTSRTIASAETAHDGAFRIESVPEGTYLLRVTNAHAEETSGRFSRQYGDLEQTIKVEGDIPNLVLAVPEQTKQHTATQ